MNFMFASVSLLHNEAKVTRHFKPTADQSSYMFATVDLKPAHYTAVIISATLELGTGRIALHTYRLYAIPKGNHRGSSIRPDTF